MSLPELGAFLVDQHMIGKLSQSEAIAIYAAILEAKTDDINFLRRRGTISANILKEWQTQHNMEEVKQ